ncbi:uncharacterized protein LOC144141287 isoform X2 [Haemaphysalis longicornis]
MHWCAVKNCPSKTGSAVSFFSFPRDEVVRDKWVAFVRRSGRPEWVPKKSSELCSLHFSTECYTENPEYLAMFKLSKTRAWIFPGSLPTILPDAPVAESAAATPKRRRREEDAAAESDARAIDSADVAIAPASEAIAPASSAASPADAAWTPPPRVGHMDAQTQAHAHVAVKSTQVNHRPETRSIGVQAGGPATQDAATSTVVGGFVFATPAGIAFDAASRSRQTQATVHTSHAGAQCRLQSFASMGCQTGVASDTFPPYALSERCTTNLVSRPEADCEVDDHRGPHRRLSDPIGSAQNHGEMQIGEGPCAGQSCEPQSSSTTPQTLLEKELVAGQPVYICHTHKKVFVQEEDFSAHTSTHAVVKSFSCQFCSRAYSDKNALLAHEKLHARGKPFICSTCDRGFSSETCLEIHEKMHAVSKPFRCQFCSQTFASRDSLNLHLSLHGESKLFCCSFCPTALSTKSGLAYHERFHSRKKPNVCSVCTKRFFRRTDLRAHMELHSGDRYFTCDICQEGFWDNSQLLKHVMGKAHAKLYAKKFVPKKQSFPLQMAD